MRKIILILSVLFTQTLFAQKVDVTDNILNVDGKPYAHIERVGGLMSPQIYFEVKNLTTKEKTACSFD